jgi:hypothetical protein
MTANRGTCRSTHPAIGAILFSGLLLFAWCAIGHTQAPTQLSGVTPCESEDRSLHSQLAAWHVSENAPETLRVGDKFVLSFPSLSSALPVAVFLVVTTPEQVRFQGEYRTVILPASKENYRDDPTELVVGPGFVAVPPNIVAPDRLEHGKDRMRAIAPLHHRGLSGFELPNTRTIGVEPLKAGPFAIEWSLVARSACGERVVFGPQKRELAVRLGRPQFVVQDLTVVGAEPAAPQPAKRKSLNIKSGSANKAEDTKAGAGRNAISAEASKKDDALPERPQRVIVSNSGAYALHVFHDRYEVLDAATGVRLFAGSGYFPNFSPTSRFVTARTGGTGEDNAHVDIVDLLAGRVTLNISGPTVAWSHGDSMLLSGGTEVQALILAMPLIDRAPAPNQKENARPNTIGSSGSGREADAWNNVNVFVSYVGSNVIVYSFDTQIVTSLIDGISRIYGDTLDVFGVHQPDEFKTVIERAVGQRDFRLPWGWHGDASVGLSMRCGACDSKEARSDFDGDKPPPLVNGLQPRPFQRDLFVAHRQGANRQEEAKGATTASRLAARNSAIQARSNWTGAGATISQGGDIAARLAEFGLPLAAHSVSQTQRLATFPASDFRGKYPKALKDRISAVLMNLDWDRAFLAGHWTFKLGDRTFHLLQHGRWPAFGWEADHLVAVAYDEHPDGTIGNIRLLSELLGEPGSENATLRDGFLIAKHWTAQMVRIRITQHQDGRLVIGVPARHRIAILDTTTMKVKLVEPIQQPELMTHAALTEDGRTVVQINQNGQFFAYEVATSRLVVSGRHADDELIMHDEAGYFTGTYEGAHFLHLRFPGEPGLHSFHQFQSRLHRPDIIAAELKGTVGLPPPPDLAIPPTVEVQLSSVGAQLRAQLTARSSEALKSVRLYQDGQLTDELRATGKDWSDIFPIKRLNSARWLSVVAVDEKGLLSQAAMLEFPLSSAIGGSTLHGVIVGIDEYDSPAFKPLQLAARDARDMAAALTANAGSYYGRVATTSLANAEALPSRVLAAVRDAVAAAVPGDTVVLFFAGHGLGDKDGQFYLATTGTNPDALKETAIPWSSLATTLQRSKARVIVLLDACHSGLAGQAAFASNDAAVAEIMSGERAPILVLAASKGRQLSLENMALGNGYFTHALKSLLGPARKSHDLNGNGVLEISELYRGVKAEVVRATSGQQTPWLARSDLIGDFSVF